MNTNNAILITILTIFILTGWIAPYVHDAFNQESTTNIDVQGFATDIGQDDAGVTAVTAGEVIFSIGSMFFWQFGSLPIFLNILFLPLRIILYVILYDKIRGI